jgi:hypothetical protein
VKQALPAQAASSAASSPNPGKGGFASAAKLASSTKREGFAADLLFMQRVKIVA